MTATSVVDGTKLIFDEKAKQWVADGDAPEGLVIPQDNSCGTANCKALDAGKCKVECVVKGKPCEKRTLPAAAKEAKAAEEAKAKDKLSDIALIQGGEIVKEPKRGNVYVLAKEKLSPSEREKVLAALNERLPLCVFTVVSKAPKAPAKDSGKK